MGFLQALARAYDHAFFHAGGRSCNACRSWLQTLESWAGLSWAAPALFAILAAYLCVIKVGAPRFMKGRQPFDLKTVITLYNVFQVIANAWIFHGLLTYVWMNSFDLGCYMPDYSNNPTALMVARLVWYELCLKVVDLVETVFFVLRGKEKQASFLHVYHHVTTVMIVYTGAKYVPGGYATFSMMVNNAVHVLMYTYYLLTLLGPRVQRPLGVVKRYLTILQMVQFVVVAVHYVNVMLRPNCPAPKFIHFLFLPYIAVMFYLFYEFYQNTYRSKKAKL